MSTYLKLGLLVLAVGVCLAVVAPRGAPPVAAAQSTGSISGRVINDLNGDGIQQPDEPGVEGWRVVLNKAVDLGRWDDIAETRTGPDGDYRFSNLAPGGYEARLPCDGQPAAQWAGTFPGRGFRLLYIGPSHTESGVDFLVEIPAEPIRSDGKIAGRVVNDLDIDGVADRREPGLVGWRVSFYREGDWPICTDEESSGSVATDSKGVFRATGLLEGAYRVGGGMHISPPRDGQTKVKHWAVTAPVQTHPEWAAGDIPLSDPVDVSLTKSKMRAEVGDTLIALLDGTGSISGMAFRDLNGNLTRDENEPPAYPTMTGLLYVKDGNLLWVYPIPFNQLPDGRYKFEGLAPGKYMVSAILSKEYRFGPFDVGKGETVADLPLPPLPPTPTPEPRPTPVPPVDLYPPETGAGGASSSTDIAGTAAALALAGALAVSATVLLHRRRSCARRARPPASE